MSLGFLTLSIDNIDQYLIIINEGQRSNSNLTFLLADF